MNNSRLESAVFATLIARVFKELNLIEEWGSGYKRIKEACYSEGYPEPKWEELGTVMRVTFFPHPETIKQFVTSTTSAPSGLALRGEQYVDPDTENKFCQEHHYLLEIMNLLGWQDRTKFRKKFIKPLIAKGLLTMTIPEKPNSSRKQYIITQECNINLLSKK